MSTVLGIIGSLGADGPLVLANRARSVFQTQYGNVPGVRGSLADVPVVQITRSGGQQVAAHAINHRANIAALASAGVTHVISTGMVGGLDPRLAVGDLVLVDQFLDFTRHHEFTYFADTRFRDVDFTDPYCPLLRGTFLAASADLAIPLVAHGCYVSVDGPRFETRAEVKMYRMLGGNVIGMTGLPECVMAREAGMCFATIAAVVNPAAGLSDIPLAAEDFIEARSQAIKSITSLIYQCALALPEITDEAKRGYCCRRTAGVVS